MLGWKQCKKSLLFDLPKGAQEIGTKWVFRNKKDDNGVVVWNKARFVVKGFNQQEGIDFTEVFAPVARLEAIRLFLAFVAFKGFKVYKLDFKSAFLYGKIQELVYVSQPPGFLDPEYPDRVYISWIRLYTGYIKPRGPGMRLCQPISWKMALREEKLTVHFLSNIKGMIFSWSRCMLTTSFLDPQTVLFVKTLKG